MLRDKIKELCKLNGVSMKQVERDLGLGSGYLSKIDQSTPGSEKLQLLADYFEIPISELSDLVPRKKRIIAVFRKQPHMSDLFSGPSSIIDHADGQSDWYIDPETAKMAQEVFADPDTRMLFDAARDAKPEDIRLAAEMLKRMKETNRDG